MDLSKLTPAPWGFRVEAPQGDIAGYVETPDDDEIAVVTYSFADGEFIALARNAFDVMMRRGWGVETDGKGEWWITDARGHCGYVAAHIHHGHTWRDPFTALVEADRWYRENVEKQT